MNNLELLHAIVWDFRDEMEGVWPCPNKYDSIRFAVTEAAEAIDADLRENSEYARNHAKDMSKEMATRIIAMNPQVAGTQGETQICSIHAFCNG